MTSPATSRSSGLPPHVPPLIGGVLLLIGLLSIPVVLEALDRPRQVTCRLEATAPSGLACQVDGGPARALATVPVVKQRRVARNTYIDAQLAFLDGTNVTTAELDSATTGNALIAATLAGGPPFTLPLATGRWIASLLLGIPVGLWLLVRFVRSRRP